MTDTSSLLTTHSTAQLYPVTAPSLASPLPNGSLSDANPQEEEDYTIKCICAYADDDGNTVYCEKCDTWQHIECYYHGKKVPEFHFCADCYPRELDAKRATEKEVMAMEDVHYPQLESLHSQVQAHAFPVNKDTLQQMDMILAKNREAKQQIIALVERSQNQDFRQRPMYAEVRDVLKALEDLNGKPHGTADLEKELKRHEDWMRKGKKLFGKANAPLHILEQHMKTVEETNSHCFDLDDTFRPPAEPASQASSSDGIERGTLGADEKPVFCICRKVEAGLMLECDICHEWYAISQSHSSTCLANMSQVSCKVPQTSTWQGQRKRSFYLSNL